MLEKDLNKPPLELQKKSFKQQRSSLGSQVAFFGRNINFKEKFPLYIPEIQLKLGEITIVLGENDLEKTSLLKILAGELKLKDAQIRYPALEKDGKRNLYKIKQQISYMPQELPQWSGVLGDYLHFTAAIHRIKGQTNKDEVDFIISRLDLEKYRDYTWKEVSSSVKRRFVLAKALIKNPKLLILDQPLANLDLNTQSLFLHDLRYFADSLRFPKAVVLSSKNVYDVENIADNIIFLKDGKALYNAKIEAFKKDRKENTYELGCNVSKEALTDLLEEIDYYEITLVGYNHFIIDTALSVTCNDIFAIFAKGQISLNYFRDISQSTRKLFR